MFKVIKALNPTYKPRPLVNETVTSDAVNEEKNPDKEIVLTINGMVKYTFIEADDKWQGHVTQFDSNDPQNRKIVRVMKAR